MSAFPNPTTGDITVRMDNDLQGNLVLQLTNYLGQEVLRQEASKQGNQWELPLQLADLPTGCYQLTITNDVYSAVKKIVKR
ncbi:MAG: T9SS type A sorting domain-containing protein [Saprospiraceae bacterium]|nr:T9SS type A sorting domain-containing protein [Saprospiraceae bacterium]